MLLSVSFYRFCCHLLCFTKMSVLIFDLIWLFCVFFSVRLFIVLPLNFCEFLICSEYKSFIRYVLHIFPQSVAYLCILLTVF